MVPMRARLVLTCRLALLQEQEHGQALHVRILLRNAPSEQADSQGSSLPDSPGQMAGEPLPASPAQEARCVLQGCTLEAPSHLATA
jgi:hypothetical protein